MQHHVFISYSRQDKVHMRSIRDTLQSAGLVVWTDEGIEVGTPSWRDMIESAIEATQCLVVVLSPDAKKSRWVKSELDYAQIQGKRIFPILVSGDERSSIPFSLASTHYADVREEYVIPLEQLISAINELTGRLDTVPAHAPKKKQTAPLPTEISVVIVDDIESTRESFKKLLAFENDFKVVGMAANGKEAIETITKLHPDIVLMDINMPVMDGIEATSRVTRTVPKTAVIMVSVQDDSDYIRRSMLAGARYFLSKPVAMDELYTTIREVHQNNQSRLR